MEIGDYDGREATLIKHKLLKSYLERLIMIIGQQKAKTIGYVDCFAGPWQERDEAMLDTSIQIAIQVLLKTQQDLESKGWERPRMRALFVEKDPSAFSKLEMILEGARSRYGTRIDLGAIHGDFTDKRQEILDWFNPRDFVFFFVDPKGWKEVGGENLAPLLRRDNSEFLINFMYQHLNRFVLAKGADKFLNRVLPANMDDVPEDSLEREMFLVRKYRESLKAVAPGWRTAFVRVKEPEADRTKFHLVYLTRHPKGIEVFMEASEKAEQVVEPAVRGLVRDRELLKKTQQPGLFESMPVHANRHARPAQPDLEEVWLGWLKETPQKFEREDWAEMLETTDCYPKDLQAAFKSLCDQGIAENLSDENKKRSKHFVYIGEKLALKETKR